MSTEATGVADKSQADAYYCEIPSDPCAIVMFGASGDLARRKLLPALYELAVHSCLAPRFRVLGFARTPMSDDQFRQKAGESLPKEGRPGADENKKSEFLKQLQYFGGDYNDPEAFRRLVQRLEEIDAEGKLGGNRLFYLATPPEIYLEIIDQLGKSGLRVIIEKPFGHNLESARELNQKLLNVLDESQVYRIDHYLGKETVQNLLVFRFSNGIFEPLWNRNYVDHVQITAVGDARRRAPRRVLRKGRRAARHDPEPRAAAHFAGGPGAALDVRRDFGAQRKNQSAAIDPPFHRETIWNSVVRGQYGPGKINGEAVPGYRQEPGVERIRRRKRIAALKLHVDNWRWSGVPFYLRTGNGWASADGNRHPVSPSAASWCFAE
jgi:glucose-6-phosphate 1-dehydrogenase